MRRSTQQAMCAMYHLATRGCVELYKPPPFQGMLDASTDVKRGNDLPKCEHCHAAGVQPNIVYTITSAKLMGISEILVE